jgi:DNA-directed RNA polymerase beta' subunit
MHTFEPPQNEEMETHGNTSRSYLKKKFLKGYSKVHELKLVSIGLASPEKIQAWAEKELPNGKIFGEVTNANTFHYRTFLPTKGGLFCERIFGPLKDFECACGKRQKPTAFESKQILEHKKTPRSFCSNCDVEYTWSILRRYQLGYIHLNTSVTHLWYLKTNPSFLSLFFDMKRKEVESLVYCTESLTLENMWKISEQKTSFSRPVNDLYKMWQNALRFDEQKTKVKTNGELSKKRKYALRQNFLSFKEKEKVSSSVSWDIHLVTPKKSNEFDLFFTPPVPENGVQKNTRFHGAPFLKKRKKRKMFFTQLEHFEKNSKSRDLPKKMFETISRDQEKRMFSFLFQNVQKNFFRKTYGNFLFNTVSRDSTQARVQKTTHFFDDLFLSFRSEKKCRAYPDSFEDFEMLSFKNSWSFFFFLLNSSFLFFPKKRVSDMTRPSKDDFLFLFPMISFLKKKHFMDKFLLDIHQGPLSSSSLLSRLEKRNHARKKKFKKYTQFFSAFEKLCADQKPTIHFFDDHFQNSLRKNVFGDLSKRKEFFSCIQQFSFPACMTAFEWFFSSPRNGGSEFFHETSPILSPKKSFFSSREEHSAHIHNEEKNSTPRVFQKKPVSIHIFNTFSGSKQKRTLQKKEKTLCLFPKFENGEFSLPPRNSSSFFRAFQERTTFFHDGKSGQDHRSPTEKFLKNPVATIRYNFLWKNDSDWNSFLYYNSFVFSEFQDSPILYFSSRLFEDSFSSFFPSSSSSGLSKTLHSGEHAKSFRNSVVESAPSPIYGVPSRTLSSAFRPEGVSPKMSIGAGILETLLKEYTSSELQKMLSQHQILLPKIKNAILLLKQPFLTKKDSVKIQKYIQKRAHILRRFKFLQKFSRKNSNPTSMILRNLPVLPPDLRPILKLENQIAASDLNRFYQRILYRNERYKKLYKDFGTNTSFEMKYAQRLLQEAVDNLIQNGKGGVKPETNSRGLPLKSLSEILKGKQGRFRQYLLGKRVDYSGRSVIVVGPKLQLHECGVPKEMAFELFLPFLIQKIFQFNLAKTVLGAKNLLKKDSDFAFHLLQKIMKNSPVLLNRAPTLHRLGFQAFLPKLVEGRALLLHPMVCPGFNADFDGDQMAVHIPLTVEARTEAWKFMLSTNNFIHSATGDPILLPTQDMVLGCYYFTTDFQAKAAAFHILNTIRKKGPSSFLKFRRENKSFLFFQKSSEVFSAYQRQEIGLHTPLWLHWNGDVDFGKNSTKPREILLRKNGHATRIHPKYIHFFSFPDSSTPSSQWIRTTAGRIVVNSMIRDFEK